MHVKSVDNVKGLGYVAPIIIDRDLHDTFFARKQLPISILATIDLQYRIDYDYAECKINLKVDISVKSVCRYVF